MMKALPMPFESLWKSDRGMVFFLVVLAVQVFIIFPMASPGPLAKFVLDVFLSVIMISGAVTVGRNRLVTMIFVVATIVGVAVHWGGVLYITSFYHPAVDAIFVMSLFAGFTVVMMTQVFRPGPVTLHRVLGAVAAYLGGDHLGIRLLRDRAIESGRAAIQYADGGDGNGRVAVPLLQHDDADDDWIRRRASHSSGGAGAGNGGSADWAALSGDLDRGSAGDGAARAGPRREGVGLGFGLAVACYSPFSTG
jgi:hypothetical protein